MAQITRKLLCDTSAFYVDYNKIQTVPDETYIRVTSEAECIMDRSGVGSGDTLCFTHIVYQYDFFFPENCFFL